MGRRLEGSFNAVVNPILNYRVEEQIGFLLRKANQRHGAIFLSLITEVTPSQLAALAELHSSGTRAQHDLGEVTAMDPATIKGVVDRLEARGLVIISQDLNDRRKLNISLSEAGSEFVVKLIQKAVEVTQQTLAPLNNREKLTLMKMLTKIT